MTSEGKNLNPCLWSRAMGWAMIAHYLLILAIPLSLIGYLIGESIGYATSPYGVGRYLTTAFCIALTIGCVPPTRRLVALWAANHARVFHQELCHRPQNT